MIFRRDIEPRCAYCARANELDEDTCLCAKRGVVSAGYKCRSFKYDPLRRVPPKPPKIRRGYSEEDFKL